MKTTHRLTWRGYFPVHIEAHSREEAIRLAIAERPAYADEKCAELHYGLASGSSKDAVYRCGDKLFSIRHLCYIASERTNKLVSELVTCAKTPLEAVLLVASNEHSKIERYPSQDSADFLCYISDLNHIFMVKTLPVA